jgi:hypothetical protein
VWKDGKDNVHANPENAAKTVVKKYRVGNMDSFDKPCCHDDATNTRGHGRMRAFEMYLCRDMEW